MAHPERYRWLDPLLVDLIDSIFGSLGYSRDASLSALVALARPGAPTPLCQRHKKQLQRARRADQVRMRDELERVLRELECAAAPEAASVGHALLSGANEHRAAHSFAEWAEAALETVWDATSRMPRDRMQPGFVVRALSASHSEFDSTLDLNSTVASLATLMGVLRDPLDHGPGTVGQVGCLAWLPEVHDATETLMPSRHRLLQRAYTERASALGASNPESPWDQACVIADALGQEVDAVQRGRTRQCGPRRLDAGAGTAARPISSHLLATHLGLNEPAPLRHLRAGALTLGDRLQRRLLAQGSTPDEIMCAFARYPLQHLRHSFDREPDWPFRLMRQIRSTSINVRRITDAVADRHRQAAATESDAR